ncbi:hypothetical protein FJTKL_07039 [Diaporthe vaccinii]|uniref:Uncharacterized protein n=1 Tax=Diaporthe vaccinii TaxID=105482 RepID=A0ABR4EUV9_9PEZI
MGERQVVFINSGVRQEELSDVEGDAKKELSMIGRPVQVVGIITVMDKLMSECVVLMGRKEPVPGRAEMFKDGGKEE